jgi:NAD+ diphosphatase
MLQTPAEFVPLMTAQGHPDPIAFVFRGGKLLVREDDLTLPDARVGLPLHGLNAEQFHPVGLWKDRYSCTTWVDAKLEPQDGFAFVQLRSLFGSMDEALLGAWPAAPRNWPSGRARTASAATAPTPCNWPLASGPSSARLAA